MSRRRANRRQDSRTPALAVDAVSLLYEPVVRRGQLRGTDIIARFGGEEFAVVLPDCDVHNAMSVLDKLRRNTPAEQTVSIGIAQWDGLETQLALLQRADTALYQAKAASRNRLHCAA